MTIEVKRRRSSVTQGMAEIYINGKKIMDFGDKIKLIGSDDVFCGTCGKPTYGENIGGWASIIPDSDFIMGLLYHPLDEIYHYSDKAKKAIKASEDGGVEHG